MSSSIIHFCCITQYTQYTRMSNMVGVGKLVAIGRRGRRVGNTQSKTYIVNLIHSDNGAKIQQQAGTS